MTDKVKEQLEHLSEMRSLMEESSQFLSLSGLSGVFAGIYALIGAYLAMPNIGISIRQTGGYDLISNSENVRTVYYTRFTDLIVIALCVLVASLITGYILTAKKAKKNNKSLFSKTAIKMLVNLFVPLGVGGLFCISMMYHGYYGAVAPVMLIFYGFALFNAGKYTYRDIRYLGLLQMTLGLIASYFIGYGLLFWAIGFGGLHIIYGLTMYIKYDRVKV